MRIGSHSRSLLRVMAGLATVTVLMAAPVGALGQMMHPYAGCGCDGCGGCGGMVGGPGDYYGDGGCYSGCCPDPYCNGGMPRPGFTGPIPMGAGGTEPPIGYDLMNDVGTEGFLIDQRGPHYFDIRAEAVYLTRDETFGDNVDFSADGAGAAANLVLFTDQLEYDYEPGFRILGRCDICPLAVLEFGYTGIFDFEDSQTFTDTDGTPSIFTLFSEFGANPVSVTNPAPGVNPMPQTEQAVTQSISIESDLQTAEISYRRYWLGWSPRISGTLLAGFRYTKLDEEFEFFSQGSQPPLNLPLQTPAGLTYTVDTDNDLSGFQLGGDMWIGLAQGLRIGSEAKAGIYANRFSITNEVATFPNIATPPTLFEEFRDTQPAFIAEASADVVADILPSISLRAGYEILFMNSLALAGQNFNPGSPYNPGPISNGNGPLREPFFADQGEALYYGGHAGIEFIW